MGRKKKQDGDGVDQKSVAAGEAHGSSPAEYVFDAPFDAEIAVEHLLELNHVFQECDRAWERAKGAAAEAKNDRDNASNAISLLLDQIDRHKNGINDEQPVLRTIPGSTEGAVN